MTDDDLPSPKRVAARCSRHSWRDEIDDRSRLLLEQAARTINVLMARTVRQAKRIELYETVMEARK